MSIFIYGLIDPFTDEVRYIGKSIRPKERLRDHCNDHSDCHRTHWIQSVRARGKRPRLVILEELSTDMDWQIVEQRWIAQARAAGWPLTNGTDGGDGVPNLCPEAKAKMIKAWKGRKHRPESLAKMAAASRGQRKSEASKQIMREKMRGRVITWADKVSKGVRKLSDDQVREIRAALAAGEKQYVLAGRYSVDKGTISNIKRGLFYTDVPLEVA
jgi:GIY-YIG catalytic domain-containing protein